MKASKITTLQGIYTQVSSVLGVFIITYPYTYSQLGFILSSACTIFMCIISAFTLYFLAKSSKIANINNFDDLIASVSNKSFSLLCSSIFYLGCLFPMVFYLNVAVEFYDTSISKLGLGNWKVVLLLVCNINVITLCIVFRKVHNLWFIIITSLLSLFTFIVYVIWTFISNFGSITIDLTMLNVKYDGLNSISFIIFAYLSHTNIISIVDCLPSIESAKRVIIFSNIFSTFIYILVGCIGFCVYPNSTYTYLENSEESLAKLLLKIFLATVNILSFPLMMITLRKNVLCILAYFHIPEFKHFDVINIVLNCCLCTFMVYIMGSMVFLKSMFFIVGTFTMFLLPMYLFYKICGVHGYLEKSVFVICSLLSAFSMYMGIRGLIGLI